MGVVDRNGPPDDDRAARDLFPRGLLDLARELVDIGRHEIADAHPDEVSDAPGGDVDHPVGRVLPVELGERAEGLRELVAARDGVQERGVDRVHAVVLDLQPVAGKHELARRLEREARQVERVVERKRRPAIGRTHVGEDEAGELVRRVRALAEPVPERARRRLARRLEDPAVHVEHPSVIAAADAALADQAEFERGAPVRAVSLEQAHSPASVPKHHQLLTHDADGERDCAQLAGEGDGLPEPAEIFAARCAGPDPGQLLVRRGYFPAEIRSIRDVQKGSRCGHGADIPHRGPRNVERLEAPSTSSRPNAPEDQALVVLVRSTYRGVLCWSRRPGVLDAKLEVNRLYSSSAFSRAYP